MKVVKRIYKINPIVFIEGNTADYYNTVVIEYPELDFTDIIGISNINK